LLDSLNDGVRPIPGAGLPAVYTGSPAMADRNVIKSAPRRAVC
jgi:hypothetical protein